MNSIPEPKVPDKFGPRGLYRVACPTCDGSHPSCPMVGCMNPTHCPADEPRRPNSRLFGVSFVYCDTCAAIVAGEAVTA
ncbi:hypothetical protein LCGC14_1218130 [marine sediment metagenome]|uniref:Uncharacterized protein n=1 Tax=marine sediment metagenome TaxID=412755 RepID=A0A0F9LG60_9ZZZZ